MYGPCSTGMGHKSLETTMRYLAPATDVHDELDLVTIPSVGKACPGTAKVRRAQCASEDWETVRLRSWIVSSPWAKNRKAISMPRSPSRSIVC